MLAYRISEAAEVDIEGILDYSFNTFGEAAARRYEKLFKVSINNLRGNINQPGVRPTLRGLSKFHVSMCKKSAQIDGVMVRDPRHLIFFRVRGKVLEIVRILHESMDFEQHI